MLTTPTIKTSSDGLEDVPCFLIEKERLQGEPWSSGSKFTGQGLQDERGGGGQVKFYLYKNKGGGEQTKFQPC